MNVVRLHEVERTGAQTVALERAFCEYWRLPVSPSITQKLRFLKEDFENNEPSPRLCEYSTYFNCGGGKSWEIHEFLDAPGGLTAKIVLIERGLGVSIVDESLKTYFDAENKIVDSIRPTVEVPIGNNH